LKYNPFNVPNDQIVGVDGKLNPSAKNIFQSLDWYEPLEQVGYRTNHNISLTGGSDTHDFLLSIGYLDERGYVVESDYERINARLNFNAQPKKWLHMGSNFSGALTTKGLASGADGNTSYANPFFFARNMGPIYPVYIVDPATGEYILDEKGEKQYDLGGGYSDLGIEARPVNPNRHIVAELDYNNNISKTNNLSNHSYVDFEPLEGLKLTISYAIDMNNYKSSEFENPIVGDGAPTGRYNQARFMRTTTNFNQLINYQKSLNSVHNFDILLGHESFSREYTESYGMMSQLIVDGIYEFDNFVTPTNLSGYTSNKKNEGYFGRVNYNYNSKYYLSASYRYDGSSVFHEDVRWGGFFSVGASWMIDKEEFIKNISFIDQLKIRTSYGQVGNDLIGSYYAYQALYATFPNASSPGLVWSETGNSELTWESNNSFDLALDFALFENKIHGSIEFYKKISEDLLYNMPLPLSMGLETQPRNIATLYNQGFEIGLGSTILETNDFKWDINILASTIKNEITKIPDPFINGSKRWAEGHSIYDFYLYEYYGVNAETGAPQYQVWEEDAEGNTTRKYDEQGNPVLTEKYTEAGQGYIGASSIPDLFGSVTNNLRYKNFSLDFMFTYSIGGKVLDYSYASLMNGGTYGNSIHIDQLDGWRASGDNTDIPRLEIGNTNINPTSSRWLTDASFLALRNVNFGYSFNTIKGVDALKVFVAGENLFMLNHRKGMDSQESFAGTTSNVYLPSRVFSLGVNLVF
jgi:TonB-linked SusC/RagA family outer membrane protein